MSAFQFADLETGEMIETDEPIRFWMHLRQLAALQVAQRHDATIKALSLRPSLAQAKANRQYIEASIAMSDAIDGKNAETRKAQIERLTADDEHWQTENTLTGELEQQVAIAEADAEAAYSRYRVTLRDLDVMAALYGPQDRA
jgi:benzoyl-CoA reductase/2-hydroxyglutaryl-CoA dehydratase subunit BcrC/BadD/HgdB